ncbi:DUF6470 family protein [Jeotgalibacillus sp. R-1-5s-1]|uniref:DUF6470 family protein n=1 Tax=Jeotgalibacillus sp. R-1-5s-1 TaxID=2555897 RepID=UPI00106C1093|nr:DUF6470 family protein [Jeotgalibacillus sp. R-1-5s-1]TFD95789.1 hypothetical protein E2491_11445 [Jeotgalibacillus sp. R-1-5s-1]
MIPSMLQYNITNARTGINYNQPVMNIKQPKATLDIKQPKADMTISTTPSKLLIDQTEAFAAMDRLDPLRRAKEYVDKIMAEYPELVKKRARQGDQMMRIENGGGAIAAIAKENGTPPMKQMVMGFIPKTPFDVKIDYQPSEVNIDVRRNAPVINSSVNRPQIDIPRWSASIYMEQMPSIDFDYLGKNINLNG